MDSAIGSADSAAAPPAREVGASLFPPDCGMAALTACRAAISRGPNPSGTRGTAPAVDPTKEDRNGTEMADRGFSMIVLTRRLTGT
jgi:hypothetical protein